MYRNVFLLSVRICILNLVITSRSSTGGRYSPGSSAKHIAQKLWLSDTGIANKQHVDVASESSLIRQYFFDAAEQQTQDGLFDVLVAVDGGG